MARVTGDAKRVCLQLTKADSVRHAPPSKLVFVLFKDLYIY